MLRTSKRRATSWFASTSTLATRSAPSCSRAICSRTGATSRQGPHHSAQKSTSRGCSDEAISSSKVLSVSAVIMSAAIGDAPPWGWGSYQLRGVPARWAAASGWDSSHRSASMAAMHPDPAAVTAWRYRWSWTSPQAKTPATSVRVEPGSVRK